MNIRRRVPAVAVAGAVALTLGTLSACSSSSGATESGEGGKLTVAASFYPMEFLAKEIGGEDVSVSNLTEPGVEPHDLELTPKQIAELGEADVIVYIKDLQPAVDEAVEQSGVENVVDTATFTTLEQAETEPGSDEETGLDPHLWLDPVKYAEAAKGVGRAFEKADPDNADTYRENTDALVEELGRLNRDFEDGLKNRTTDTFITSHSAFGYLAQRYGLKQEGIAGLEPDSEPSSARMKELQETAKKEKVSTVFFETLVSDKTAKSLANDTGLKTDVLDPVEGITGKSQGDDYIGVMRANLKNLAEALGAA